MEMTVQESQLNNEMENKQDNPKIFIDAAGLPVREGSLEETKEVYYNLATIQKIKLLSPIEGADKIELAKMEDNEWQVVVQKGLHQVGDPVCYIQIDTICPERPWAEFLRDRHFRVRTIRLKQQLSQGLIIPLKDLENEPMIAGLSTGTVGFAGMLVGDDLTTLIDVTKYEKPIPANLRGVIRATFPSHLVSSTDEERLQNCSRILEELKDVPVYITVKMDGTSATYINHGGDTHVCSRRMDLKPPAEGDKSNVYWDMENKYNILQKLISKGNYAVQGEVVGPRIQGNKAGLKEVMFMVFNVYNLMDHRYLNFNEMTQFVMELGLPMVPILEYATLLNDKTFDDMLKMADGLYPNNTPREGIVVRPTEERYSDYMKGRVSFKVVSNEFLLKYKE